MRIATFLLAGLVASVSVVSTHAATLSVAQTSAQDALVLIKKSKKKKDKAGYCGEYKFFDKKEKKCSDARKKKSK